MRNEKLSPYLEYRYNSADNPSGKNAEILADRIITYINRFENVKRICDLGCGNGYLTNRLASSGYQVTGVDASRSGIAAAKEVKNDNAVFICEKIDMSLHQKLGRQTFDTVISSEVIEHLYTPSELLESEKLLLRPRGYLVLTTPYHGYLKYLVLSVLGRMDDHLDPSWDGGHIKFFTVGSLSKLMRKHGFKELEFFFFGRVAWLWKSMICIGRK